MSISKADLIKAGKQVAQEQSGTPLLTDGDSYERAVDMALRVFDVDRPNRRIVHHTVTASAFRFVLAGTGALAGMTGLNAWVRGKSALTAVWHPYDTASRDRAPLDSNTWRLVEEPDGSSRAVVLELLELTPSSGVLRLEFTSPHVIGNAAADGSMDAGDVPALKVLVGAQVLMLYAVRSVQNTGSTGLAADVVDRRSQASEAKALAKELMARYRAMVGQSSEGSPVPVSAIGELDIQIGGNVGPMWKTPGSR